MIEIAVGTEADLDAVCLVAEELLEIHAKNAPTAFAPHGLERDREYWRNTLLALDGSVLLAKDGGKLLGFIVLRFVPAPSVSFLFPQKIARINTIVVTEQARGQGVGQQLLDAAYAWAKELGAVEMKLEVFAFNQAAIALYQRNGFNVQSWLMRKVL